LQAFFNFDKFYLIKSTARNLFFYPMNSKNIVISYIEYISMLFGLLALLPPIIYSFFHKNNFSRNSYWVILSIALVLANPYFFIFDLIILIVPLLIVINLMLADRVQYKYIILILISFSLIIIAIFILSLIILIQLFALILWFFMINGMLAVRIRKYTPRNFISYWHNY